ncbi:MAG: MFS transporter, partial [Sinobacteraceae bacterium]|nr:MFS transporter [Nevskiaceae bacterium]
YDSINPLERVFIERLGFTATTFGWLNASYAATAILTLLVGGIAIDRLGTRRAVPIFAVICLAGALLTAASGHPTTMIAGRALLGLGGESLVVAATTVIARWFKGKELAFAFGIKVTLARLASVAADNSPAWAHHAYYPQGPEGAPSWQGPLLLAAGAGLVGVVAAATYARLERPAADRGVHSASGQRSAGAKWWTVSLRFSPSYWFVVGICLSFYSAIIPFRTFAIDFFTSRLLAATGDAGIAAAERALAHQHASSFASLLPLSAMIATPLLGLLSDRIGRRASLMLGAALLLCPVYLLLGYTLLPLWMPLLMMGVAFAVIPAVMWPSVAYLVAPSRLGTAYALMTLIEQLGFFCLNLIIGSTNDHEHAGPDHLEGYRPGMWIFTAVAAAGVLFAALLRLRESGRQAHGLETVAGSNA